MTKDDFGNRMKMYEKSSCTVLDLTKPVIARIDGKCFSSFTKGLARPYDERLTKLMQETTEYLVTTNNAFWAFTQSDEISLVLWLDDGERKANFAGRVQKYTSILAAQATVLFNSRLAEYIPEKSDRLPVFDCRIFNVPDEMEAMNALFWREKDAVKNSISMLARTKFSHKELKNQSGKMMIKMLSDEGVSWKDQPSFFTHGTHFHRTKILIPFTIEEIENLPERHEARTNPNLLVERSQTKLIANHFSNQEDTEQRMKFFCGEYNG